MRKITRKLSEYNRIHAERDSNTVTLGDLAEAAVFFDNTANQFESKAKDIKNKLKDFKQADMFAELGLEREDLEIGEDAYSITEHTITSKKMDKTAILALNGVVNSKYFIVTTTINEALIYQEYIDGVLPPSMVPHVSVDIQMGLGIRRKPEDKKKKKGGK